MEACILITNNNVWGMPSLWKNSPNVMREFS